MSPALPALFLVLALRQADVPPSAPIGALLARAEDARAEDVESLAREMLALGDVKLSLFQVLGQGRLPAAEADDEGPGLNEVQESIVIAALRGLGRSSLQGLVEDVLERPGSAARIRAALRVHGLIGTAADLRTEVRLLSAARELGWASEVDTAFEESMCTLLARDEQACASLRGPWPGLEAGHASAVVRALERTRTPASLRCAVDLLGRRDELDTSLLLAIGNLAELASGEQAEELSDMVQRHLLARDTRRVQAAATALARLRVPSTVPYLIELLVSEDAVLARAALGALRAIGGVSFPAAPNAWRTWYGAEETWWQERAPELLATLADAEESGLVLAEHVALLRELTEHSLHRSELSAGLACTLSHPDPQVRVLGCQALQRLGSRSAVPLLVPLLVPLDEKELEVSRAAHAALVAITHDELPPVPEAWARHLAGQDLRLSE